MISVLISRLAVIKVDQHVRQVLVQSVLNIACRACLRVILLLLLSLLLLLVLVLVLVLVFLLRMVPVISVSLGNCSVLLLRSIRVVGVVVLLLSVPLTHCSSSALFLVLLR